MIRATLEQQFKQVLIRCVWLSFKQKKNWYNAISFLPNELLFKAYKILETHNKKTDQCLQACFKNNLEEKQIKILQGKLKKLKKMHTEIQSSTEKKGADKTLQMQINNLND